MRRPNQAKSAEPNAATEQESLGLTFQVSRNDPYDCRSIHLPSLSFLLFRPSVAAARHLTSRAWKTDSQYSGSPKRGKDLARLQSSQLYVTMGPDPLHTLWPPFEWKKSSDWYAPRVYKAQWFLA